MQSAPSIDDVRHWIADAEHVAALTGAGISAESGIPTFRDQDNAYWAQYRPEEMASEAGYRAQPQHVWQWYEYRRALVAKVRPNAGHLALAHWQQQRPGRMRVITQNVDGLHQAAGSHDVLCLHGQLAANRWLNKPCPKCDLAHATPGEPPYCAACGNLLRPAVVWFGEALPPRIWQQAVQAAESASVLLVVGTSGGVYPAASLAVLARNQGAKVVVINTQASQLDEVADGRLLGSAAQVLPQILKGEN